MSIETALLVVAIALVAGGIVGYSGFGFNLVSVPVLAMLIGAAEAIVVTLAVGAILSGVLGVPLRKHVAWSTTMTLVVGSLPGLIAGSMLVGMMSPDHLKRVVGAIVMLSAVWLWTTRMSSWRPLSAAPELGGRTLEAGVGLVSGVMVAGAAMSGPPVVWLFAWRGVSSRVARASTTVYVAVIGALAVAVFAAAGPVAIAKLRAPILVALGAALAGLVVGNALHRRYAASYAVVSVAILALSGLSGLVLSVR